MRGLCTEGNLIFKLIGLACSGKEMYHFCLVLLCIREQIPTVQASRGAYIQRGDLTEGFCLSILGGLYLEGLIYVGAYFRNFTVSFVSLLKTFNYLKANRI